MSASEELTKLETMFHHQRDRKHMRFLNAHPMYMALRSVGGKGWPQLASAKTEKMMRDEEA